VKERWNLPNDVVWNVILTS